MIAIHLAEYKALSELFNRIQSGEIQEPAERLRPVFEPVPIGKTVHPLQFTVLDGAAFERLVHAYVCRLFPPQFVTYLGQAGKDRGRDIWVDDNDKSCCYQCANYRALTFRKAKDDIDKLVYHKTIPDALQVVCGGSVSAGLREKITGYAALHAIGHTIVWSAVELEEELRLIAPDLLKRFFSGDPFPEAGQQPSSLIIRRWVVSTTTYRGFTLFSDERRSSILSSRLYWISLPGES